MSNFAHKAAFNTTKAAYATADAATVAAKATANTARSVASATSIVAKSTWQGLRAGFEAAKLARTTATTKLVK